MELFEETHEVFVSVEVAKLLKEAGFDWPCVMSYDTVSNNGLMGVYGLTNHNKTSGFCSAPTLAVADKWLREVYGLFISIGNDDLNYNYQIFDVKNRTEDLDPTCLTSSYGGIKCFEEALERGIKECLEMISEQKN